jgi:hypothetical protein
MGADFEAAGSAVMGSGGEGVEGGEGSGGVGGGGRASADLLQGLTPSERCDFCFSVLSCVVGGKCVWGAGVTSGAFFSSFPSYLFFPPLLLVLSRGPGPISYTTTHIRRQKIISRTLAAREAQKRKASQV